MWDKWDNKHWRGFAGFLVSWDMVGHWGTNAVEPRICPTCPTARF